MPPKNVMVFPCGSEIGLELFRALRYSPHLILHGASSVKDHGGFVYARHVSGLPMVTEDGFLAAFVRVLKRHRIEYVFPAHDEALVRLAEWEAAGKLPAEVIAPKASVCRLCRSKSATYARFADTLPTPALLRPDALAPSDFPVFVKPDAGQGSRGAARVDDQAALKEVLRQTPDHLVCEYLPGREYTVDCLTDRRRSLLYVSQRLRGRIAGGIAVNSEEAREPNLRPFAEAVNRNLGMRGAWFFQVREAADGTPKLLEIAPRIAGTSGLQRAKGVNLPLLSFYDRLGLDLEVIENRLAHAEIDRALANRFRLSLEYDEVYMDLDDTLLVDGLVNAEAVRFLYQCLNRGVRLVLVTRHTIRPEDTLAHFRLLGLFDEIVWFQDNESKASAIRTDRAIFIDDSFAERADVHERLGIPVFDPSAIEALLDP